MKALLGDLFAEAAALLVLILLTALALVGLLFLAWLVRPNTEVQRTSKTFCICSPEASP